jgi:hypothetical protein
LKPRAFQCVEKAILEALLIELAVSIVSQFLGRDAGLLEYVIGDDQDARPTAIAAFFPPVRMRVGVGRQIALAPSRVALIQ